MIAVGVSDAKTQFSKLIERVGRGERFLITRHGKPVAQLVPAANAETVDVNEVIRRMSAWQEEHGPTLGSGLAIQQLREGGRR